MKRLTLLLFCVLWLINCKEVNLSNLPDNYFVTDVEMINFTKPVKVECQIIIHEDYTGKEFIFKEYTNDDEFECKNWQIQYYKNKRNYYLFVRQINNKYRAFVYCLDAIFADDDIVSIYPENVEGNISEEMFKKYFKWQYEKYTMIKYALISQGMF